MLGGLTMCESSVRDGEQQSEQNDGYTNLGDDWNDEIGNWVQNDMMNGHNIGNWVQNEMTNGHKICRTGHSVESVV